MSLKVFHVLFIVTAALLAVVCGAWCWNAWRATGASGPLLGLALSAALGLALLVYGGWFYRKLGSLP